MEANTAECLECDIEEPLVIHGSCELNVSKVSRVGFVVYVTEAGVVGPSVDGAAVDRGLIAMDSRGNFPPVDGDGLCDRVLFLTK